MKVFLLLNGPEGWQTGIEDGFIHLKAKGIIDNLQWFYYHEYARKKSPSESISSILRLANNFQPDLIVFFHISTFPIREKDIAELRKIKSHPLIAYDEGDMYGTWAKPITKSMKILAKKVDIISLRGLGNLQKTLHKYNKNIIYTPHSADISRFDNQPSLLPKRQNDLIFIGNKIKPRILSQIRRMPGAFDREVFVRDMGKAFPNNFNLYGMGWDGFVGYKGIVEFQNQMDFYRDSWITLAYEHYPKEPYYFSNRLPIALMSGSLYVCHLHEGYYNIFKNTDFIYFFTKNSEAIEISKYLLSLSKTDLFQKSQRARQFSLNFFHPNIIWENFLNNILLYKIIK